MSTPLKFQSPSSGNAYGTHSAGKARQRRNPSDYGPFSSPNASFDDPFPPYAELPFTSLKRRRQLQDGNSFVKFAMKAVLMSPMVVLVLWSVGTVLFARNHNIGHSNRNSYRSSQRQSKRNSRNNPLYGNGQNMVGIPQQQLAMQDQQGNLIYNVNGNAMMMAPLQAQQQLQMMNGQQVPINNLQIANGYQQQQQQQGGSIQMQPQGNTVPMAAPLGNVQNANVITTPNNLQLGQQPQQVMQQQIPQQGLEATNDAAVLQASNVAQQQLQQLPEANLASNVVPDLKQVPAATSTGQDQLQASPAKQAVYYYDPKETKMTQTGEIVQMPALVYDGNGKAVPLEEIKHVAPIFVQAPVRGSTMNDAGADSTLAAPSARGASLVSDPTKEASMKISESWGTSTSQDQTIIVATVAVMALLVGALSARRLRSKSFLSACIENEALEDDMAYDDAYTTTAMGADSSYNTFGGWKGDLEKFDV